MCKKKDVNTPCTSEKARYKINHRLRDLFYGPLLKYRKSLVPAGLLFYQGRAVAALVHKFLLVLRWLKGLIL